ncbi:MAG: glycosyltransferase, partial [Gammaproteobacteria bacterium]|nr:glycosyltransferase [Gammaproteobacteria bacterium]
GIDTRIWDPQHDPDIAAPFDKERLDERDRNRAPLLIEMGLPVTEPRVPLFGLVSRLVPQKGVDLLLAALPEVLESGAQLVVLGSGMPLLEQQLRQMQQQWPTQLAVWVGYSEPLAHRLVAGVDVLLVPSRFEPCGLTQMYALRYGALPLVRKTGGLADTVDEQSGFLFEEVSVESLRGAMNQVLDAFQDQAAWRERQQYAMGRALDWSRSAKQYKAVYQQLLPTDTGSMK